MYSAGASGRDRPRGRCTRSPAAQQPGPAVPARRARALAAGILESTPTSVRISLQVTEETRGIPDVVTQHSPALDELMVSADATEGLTAFAHKRKPVWHNR